MITGRQGHLRGLLLSLLRIGQSIHLAVDHHGQLKVCPFTGIGLNAQRIGAACGDRHLISDPDPFLTGFIEFARRLGQQGIDTGVISIDAVRIAALQKGGALRILHSGASEHLALIDGRDLLRLLCRECDKFKGRI